MQQLASGDRALLVSGDVKSLVPFAFRLTDSQIERLLTKAVTEATNDLVLVVKRPDYLGSSRWKFRLGDHPIEAKITDEAWLRRFQAGLIPLRPGDALVAKVLTAISHGFEGNVVRTRYFVIEVRSIQRVDDEPQILLLPGPS